MPPSRACNGKQSLALIVCCGVAALAADEAAAQAATPLRVDPALLGQPPAEKKPAPAQPAEPAAAEPTAEKARADVQPVDAQAVERRALEPAAVPEPRPAVPTAPAAAPASPAIPAAAPALPARAPAKAPAARDAAAESSVKTTTLTPLRVHPDLLRTTPALAGTAPAPGVPRAPSAPATLAGIDQGRETAWRAGQPPVLRFSDEAPELPDTGAAPAALRGAPALQPLRPGDGVQRPIFLIADEMTGITDREMVASGSAEARQAGAVVSADRLTYWPIEDELEAAGNVRLEQGEDLVTGPRMRMKIASQTGVFEEPSYSLKREAKWAAKERERQERGVGGTVIDAYGQTAWQQATAGTYRTGRPEPGSLMNVLGVSADEPAPLPQTEAHGSAERIDFEGENRLRIINGSYTTCKPDDPGWHLRAKELALDYDREVGEGHSSTVYFQDVPIFWAPWLPFPLNNQRRSGFLAPTGGSSTSSGLTLSTPYYWNIAPDMDATISPRVYSKRGIQLATEYRYLGYHHTGNVRAEYLPSDQQSNNDSRYAYAVLHQQNLGRGFSGSLNLSGVSDDRYFTDLSSRSVVSSQRQLLRQGVLTYGGGWWSASVIGQSYQTLNPDPDPSQRIAKPYSFAPRIEVSARRPDFYGTDFAFFGQYTSFTHDTLTQGKRTVAYPQLSLPFVQPGWYVTPKFGVHATNYSLDRRTNAQWSESISRTLPILSVDAGMTFERETSWFGADAVQTLEPRLYYLNVPYREQAQIPNFDSAIADFNFAQIFSENQFLGYDRVSDANQLTAAVTSRLIDPTSGAEAMRAMFGQRYYFRRQRVDLDGQTIPGQTQDKWNRSDFLAAFSGRILPKTWLDAALQYNPSDRRTERSSIGVRYQPELGKVLNASYRFASDQVSGGDLKNVDISGQWPIWGGWSAVGRYNYSILDHKPVETVAGLEYGAGCWAIRLVSHQVATLSGRSNTSFFIQLELNDFARIGSNPVDLLRRNIQGYGLSNQPIADPVFGE
ncbi:MAG: LPS assembly protein LptD [Rhodocyclaceae bacterium]|nr:LPS assembly protein LptD [Rhodocyclaceae bacterium]